MPRFVLAGVLLAVLGGTPAAASPVPDDPSEICPLLIGESIPSAPVRNVIGDTVALSDVVQGTATLLIFYRGGW
ncbi:MAG: hypothetical protein GF346_03980 [Candidatus Eisenbacteria bacterium]|nr:hypothetical protein [Candidatus Latescibacterota bacterium]MBD3301584.1 hypothetical protein [Candidatus Eisenbacteria bacterium]